jgi:L-fuconolactonase
MYTGDIVDTHFHVFRRADVPQYVLLSARVVQRDFSLADYRAAMGDARVTAGVLVQAADVGTGMDELAFVERLPPSPLAGRYVSFLPINRDDAVEIVHQLVRHALLAGVRFSQVVDAEGRLFDREASLKTLAALAQHGLVYELSIRPWQYAGGLELARAAPHTTFVLGHLGKPRITPGTQPDWYAGIERFAALPNVVCKISVPLEGPDDPPHDAAILRPLVRHVVEAFGYDRVMFGSNYPVNLISVTCAGWLAMLHAFLPDASPDALDKLYRRNALRVYRVDQGPIPCTR